MISQEKPPTFKEHNQIAAQASKSSYFYLSEVGLQSKDRDLETGRNVFWTTDPNVELPILMHKEGPASLPPSTVPQAFKESAFLEPDRLALQVERDGKKLKWAWKKYYNEARSFAKAMISLGVRERAATNIIGCNTPEWFIAFTGTIMANNITAGVYTTNSPDACLYVATNSEAEVIVADTCAQIKKYEEVLDKLDQVKAFVVYLD